MVLTRERSPKRIAKDRGKLQRGGKDAHYRLVPKISELITPVGLKFIVEGTMQIKDTTLFKVTTIHASIPPPSFVSTWVIHIEYT